MQLEPDARRVLELSKLVAGVGAKKPTGCWELRRRLLSRPAELVDCGGPACSMRGSRRESKGLVSSRRIQRQRHILY